MRVSGFVISGWGCVRRQELAGSALGGRAIGHLCQQCNFRRGGLHTSMLSN